MGKIRTDASLHPTTVQKVANNTIAIVRSSRTSTRPKNSKVKRAHYLDGVDPLIAAWVRENKINYRRVEVVSSDIVIIHNPKVK